MAEWIDFKRVKQLASFPQVLAHYNISLRKVNAEYLRGRCPLPTHSSKESRESFSVHLPRNIWSCKSASCVAASGRKGGNILDFVCVMDQCPLPDAAKKLTEWFENKAAAPVEERVAISQSKPAEPLPTETPNKPLSFELKGIAYHTYLESRGISKEIAQKFGIGFFPGKGSMAGRIVIPIRNEHGELVAYAGRSVNGEEPKYKLPPGFQKHLLLYNRHALQGSVCVLVEGFMDCIRVSAHFPCIALMGCSMSEEQEKLLPASVYLMLDGDDAGRNAARELLPRIARNRWVKMIELNDGKQPDLLSSEEISDLLAARA